MNQTSRRGAGTILLRDGLRAARRALAAARAVVSDIDGVLLVSGRATPGARELLEKKRCVCVSNNSTHTAETLSEVFAAAGLSVRPQDLFLAGEAAVSFLKKRFSQEPVLALASGDILKLAARELSVIDPEDCLAQTPSAVLVCRDETLTFEKLQCAANALHLGAAAIVANPDLTHPAACGRVHLETGAIWQALRAQCLLPQQAVVVGKPSAMLVHEAARHMGAPLQELVFLGDNLLTDAAAAQAAGMPFIHVGAGGFSLEDLLRGG